MCLSGKQAFDSIIGMKNTNRRLFLKKATVGAVGAVAGFSVGKTTVHASVTAEQFVEKSELVSQRAQLIDSIIKKNPKHVLLSENELSSIQNQSMEQLEKIFLDLAKSELSEQDLSEISAHLSSPEEKKWVSFHRKCVDAARKQLVSEVELAILVKEKNGKA